MLGMRGVVPFGAALSIPANRVYLGIILDKAAVSTQAPPKAETSKKDVG